MFRIVFGQRMIFQCFSTHIFWAVVFSEASSIGVNILTTSYVWKRLLRQIERLGMFFQHPTTLKRRSLPWIGWFFPDIRSSHNQQPTRNQWESDAATKILATHAWWKVGEECLETIGPKEKIEFGVWCYKSSKRSMRDEKIFWCFQVFWDAYLKSDYMHWYNVVFQCPFFNTNKWGLLQQRPAR